MKKVFRSCSLSESTESIDARPRRNSTHLVYNENTTFSQINLKSYESTSVGKYQNENGSAIIKLSKNVVSIDDNQEVCIKSNSCLNPDDSEESVWTALKQLIIPFLIAGFGNVAAGIILNNVQHWEQFEKIPQLIILVPALLGLKGNVEMTLVSRLSTHSNLGQMDSIKELKTIIIGNMALVQCQAAVVGLIAPLFAILLSFISNPKMSLTLNEVIIVTASSVITANIANLFLGSLMCLVVTLCRRFNINPDNIGTPIAASLGDFTTMLLLAYVSRYIFNTVNWISVLILLILMSFTPLYATIARRVSYTRSVLYTGWFPILGAMVLQNSGGLIMEKALTRFDRIAAFQPVINGVGGNLVAIQSSRMSTYLHKIKISKLTNSDIKVCSFPFATFFGKNQHNIMARLLVLIAGPSHLLFLFALRIVKGHFVLTFPFLIIYILTALVQIAILLDLCNCLVNFIFRKGLDPDSYAIPLLTALADLLGSALLALAFFSLFNMNDPNAYDQSSSANFTFITSNNTLY